MRIAEKLVSLKNGRQMSLRSPREEDAEQLLLHLRRSFRESYRNMNSPPDHFDGMSVEDEQKIVADFATSASKFMISAMSDRGEIVGSLGFFGSTGSFLKHVGRLGMDIESAYQNIGLGTEMLRYALLEANEAGFHRVELSVRTFNQPGILLYEKVGFERIGLLKHAAFIDGQYCDEYLYQILL